MNLFIWERGRITGLIIRKLKPKDISPEFEAIFVLGTFTDLGDITVKLSCCLVVLMGRVKNQNPKPAQGRRIDTPPWTHTHFNMGS